MTRRSRNSLSRSAAIALSAIASWAALATPALAAQPSEPNAPGLTWVDAQSWLAEGHQIAVLPTIRFPSRSTAQVAAPNDVPDPDLRTQCQQQSNADTAAGWIKNRFETCFHKPQTIALVDGNNNQVGTLQFDEWILGFAYDGSRRVDYVASIENLVVGAEPGQDATTWAINMQFSSSSVNSTGTITPPSTQDRDDLLGTGTPPRNGR